jgi:hypothetical protein
MVRPAVHRQVSHWFAVALSLHLSPIDSSLPRTPELSWEAEELERQLQSKLNLPLRYHRGRDHAGSSRAIGDVVIGLRKDRMVEGVEELGSKLNIEPVCHIEYFSRRQVCCYLSRSFKNVLVRIAETRRSMQSRQWFRHVSIYSGDCICTHSTDWSLHARA